MANKTYDENCIKSIADAIRNKNSESISYKISEMPEAINNIVTSEDVIDAMGFNNNFPDKYNCGCKISDNEMLVIDSTSSDGLTPFKEKYPELSSVFTYRTSNTVIYIQLNFTPGTTSLFEEGKEYIIEGIDFTNFTKFQVGQRQSGVPAGTIIFRNCKIPSFQSGYVGNKYSVNFRFEHCNIVSLSGGDYDFEWCFFENKNGDGINPGSYVHGKNFYIYNYISKGTNGVHVDGIQLYGDLHSSENTVRDVSFENYRCELIPLKWSDATSYVNDPIMVQVEFSGCDDITFKHCYINGGASSVDINNGKDTNLKINNVNVIDTHVGTLRTYTVIKQTCEYLLGGGKNITNINLNRITETAQAYCGSVWKDEGNVYDVNLCLTNHTNEDRDIVAVTEDGVTNLQIEKCMNYSDVVEDETTLEDFPFDIVKTVSTNGTSFVDVYDAAKNSSSNVTNLIPLKKYKFDDMIKVQDIELPFETYTDGSVIFYDLISNQTITPSNTNYRLKYSTTDDTIVSVSNGYLIIRDTGDCVVTIYAGNHYKKEIPVSISEITYDPIIPTFYGSDYELSDFELSEDLPYFFAGINSGNYVLVVSSEPLLCASSAKDRLTCIAGTEFYIYNQETKNWDLSITYEETTIKMGFANFSSSTFTYTNYDVKSSYGGVHFSKNYDYLKILAAKMRQNQNN